MTHNVVSFTKVRAPNGWLSNMSPHPIVFAIVGAPIEWRTVEHLFQALRFPVDSPVREIIRAERSPMSAKMIAKQHLATAYVEPRSSQDLDNMRFVLTCKLYEHPDLVQALLATGEAAIHEDVTARSISTSASFWGARRVGDTWVGESWLGRLWMEQRWRVRRPGRSVDIIDIVDER